ncbi:MAG: damage-inducible protein DinB [Bryobacterales bacterium]|nr:damage-inducible protein DinB [Bryobacterales bacterium]
MIYPYTAIAAAAIPRAADPAYQHVLDTYASETNKVVSVWREFQPADLTYQPHARSSSVGKIMEHQLLSERRFFGEFLGVPEPPPAEVLPVEKTPGSFAARMAALALPRLPFLAARDTGWWLEEVPFFDARRERIWVFWRRVLHTAHHRTQLTVYLRLLGKKVVATYGPTADVTWDGADPTLSVESAGR